MLNILTHKTYCKTMGSILVTVLEGMPDTKATKSVGQTVPYWDEWVTSQSYTIHQLSVFTVSCPPCCVLPWKYEWQHVQYSHPKAVSENLFKNKQGTLSKSFKSEQEDCTYTSHIHRIHRKHLSLYPHMCLKYANYNISKRHWTTKCKKICENLCQK